MTLKGPGILAGLLLLGGAIFTVGFRTAHGQVTPEPPADGPGLEPSAAAPGGTQGLPVLRGMRGIKERARSLSAALDVEVTVFESPGGLVCLRAGDAGGPTVVVVSSVDGDGFAARGRLATTGQANGPAGELDQAMEEATSAIKAAARGGVGYEPLARASVTVILGPGNRLAAAMEARTKAQCEADFDLNFPWRWDEARAARGRSAGPYPASRPDVLALSDFLLGEGRIASVLRSRPTPLGPHSAPASFAAFVKGRLKLDHRSPEAGSALGTELRAALAELPDLRLSKPVWRRMGSHSWVVDLKLENHGLRPTGPSDAPAKELRLPRGIELGVQVRGESYRWLACGAAPLAPVALEDRPIRSGKAHLPSLGPGEDMRLRLVIGTQNNAVRELPVLDVTAQSGRALGAAILGFAPPADQ